MGISAEPCAGFSTPNDPAILAAAKLLGTRLAKAGYRVAAPDVRGFGGSDKPHAIEAYTIKDMCADIDGLIAAFGAGQAVVIGHDAGGPIAYGTALFHPNRVRAVAGLGAPPVAA